MRRTILAMLTLLTLLTGCRTAAPRPQATLVAAPLWELRIDPLADLHYWVRMLAFRPAERPDMPGLADALGALRQQGDPRTWGIYDGSMIGASSAADLAKTAAELPESLQSRGGQTVLLREPMTRLAEGYGRLEGPFREKVWPRHREKAERADAYLRRHLLPRSAEVFADLARSLDVAVPATPIPVYVVAEAPFPRAFTFRSQTGPFSVVAPEGAPGTLWDEIVIHETVHALDALSGERGVIKDLRRRLSGILGASAQEVEEFAHTLMFAQAAGTVRRVLDPAHKDYGDVAGYYPKVPRAAAVVVPAWREYLAGGITRDEALDRIVRGFEKGKGDPKVARAARGEGEK
jgi:hypothetical protein